MKEKMKSHIIAAGALVVFIVLGLACATSPEALEQQAVKEREKRVKGFQNKMRKDLIDPAQAVVEFYPDDAQGGLLFIQQIDDKAVNYEGYQSSFMGKYDCYFYLQPGEHKISKVHWRNKAVISSSDGSSKWADNLEITYNFEAGKYYKLWGETYVFDTGKTGLFRYEDRVKLNISQLN
ncbi:hypothetical protein R84B8_02757 [Treponema sp. R8-4-B8]